MEDGATVVFKVCSLVLLIPWSLTALILQTILNFGFLLASQIVPLCFVGAAP